MTKKIRISVAYLVITLLSMLLIASYVYAEDTASYTTAEATISTFTERKQKQIEATKAEAEKKREEAKVQARQKVEDAKKEGNATKTDLRQKTCEARADALKNKIEATTAAAIRHQEKIDEFNAKIDVFVQKYNLNVANYDTLIATIATKAAASEQSVASLTSYPSTIDCTNVDAAAASAITYKTLTSSARDSLREYRLATKDLLVTVKAAAQTIVNNSSSANTNKTEAN